MFHKQLLCKFANNFLLFPNNVFELYHTNYDKYSHVLFFLRRIFFQFLYMSFPRCPIEYLCSSESTTKQYEM